MANTHVQISLVWFVLETAVGDIKRKHPYIYIWKIRCTKYITQFLTFNIKP